MNSFKRPLYYILQKYLILQFSCYENIVVIGYLLLNHQKKKIYMRCAAQIQNTGKVARPPM